VWDWIKDCIEKKFPEKMSYDKLRAAVKEAWDAVPEEYLMELLDSMDDRCEAVKLADGMHTKY